MNDIGRGAAGLAPSSRPWVWREIAATFALSWPLIVANLAQTLMSMTDVVMLGRLSPSALAAGALGFNLFLPMLLFGLGVTSAVAPIAASLFGGDPNDIESVRRAAHQSFISALLLCVPMWAVLWNARAILVAFGEDPALATLAQSYLHGLQWALAPGLLFLAVRSVYSALNRTSVTLVAAVLAVLVNAVGNWGLIFGHFGLPAWGVFGSGAATSISNVFMLIVIVGYGLLERNVARYRLFAWPLTFDWPRMRALWRLGLPIGAAITFEITIFSATVLLMGLIGTAALAAHAIVFQLASLAFMVPLGVSQAATVRVGHSYGARDRRGVSRAGWIALGAVLCLMVGTATIMLAFPRLLISGFIDGSDAANAAIVAQALIFLRIAALFQIFDGVQAVASGMLRGVHDARAPMWIALFGYWGVGLPLGAALAFGTPLRGTGLWIGLASGLALVSALLVLRWRRKERSGFFVAA
jgi:MATE family multidrug resistance protein